MTLERLKSTSNFLVWKYELSGTGRPTKVPYSALDGYPVGTTEKYIKRWTTLAKAHENLIRKIYDNRSGQFRSSTQAVQASVKNRLRQEMSMAITMLRNGSA